MRVCIFFLPGSKDFHLPVCNGPVKILFIAHRVTTDHGERSWVSIWDRSFLNVSEGAISSGYQGERLQPPQGLHLPRHQLAATSTTQCPSAPWDNRLDGFHTLRLLLWKRPSFYLSKVELCNLKIVCPSSFHWNSRRWAGDSQFLVLLCQKDETFSL